MVPIKDLLGNEHLIKSCTASDIQLHYDMVKHLIPEWEHTSYRARMVECMELGTAFALSDDSCFFYYKKDTKQPKFAEGMSLYGVNNPLKVAAMFLCIFTKIDPKVFILMFNTHEGRNVSEYRSIATIASIKRHNSDKTPLMVRVDELLKKVSSITERRMLR